MVFVNKCSTAASPGWTVNLLSDSELYGPDPYDINFAYPLYEDTLQNDRVKLVPFTPSVHATTYWEHVGVEDRAKELYRYYPFTLPTLAHHLSAFDQVFRKNPHSILFAVLDKTRNSEFAGIIGLLNASPQSLTASPAFVLVFPAFQRTHVAKDMTGLLLRYALQLPNASPPGLGLRRVQWTAHTENVASVRLAARMGFIKECVTRWTWILPREMNEMGRAPREGDPFADNNGRDTIILAVCWDDWEGGVRDRVEGILNS